MRLFLFPLSARPVFLAALASYLCMTGIGCSRKTPPTASRFSSAPTEQCWIIGSVAKDLTNLAVFSAGSPRWVALPTDAVAVREATGGVPGQGYAVTVRLAGGGEPLRNELKITGSVWSPGLYVPLVRDLFTRLHVALPTGNEPGGALPDADLLKVLATPLTAEMEVQNQRLSRWLQGHPLDAQAHEQAALLLSTLALRENSGLFWNPRGLCNRAAAHLAFARALRPEASESGEVAELLIGLIIDTKADCQGRIAALQSRVAAHPELGPWASAAALRNTRDYRLLKDPQNASLLERIELFRALSEAISGEEAIKRLENLQPDTIPDWERIILQVGCSVGSGHQFALPSIRLEMDDAVQVLSKLRTAQAPNPFAEVMNQPPGDTVQAGEDGLPRLVVIDQGTWAQYFQRHLLQAANVTYDFLQNLWGVPDEAKNLRVQMGPLLKRLTLYPLCLTGLGKEEGDALFRPAADLLNQHPEWVGDRAWAGVVRQVPAQDANGGSWATLNHAWFSPGVPTGTVYGFDWRLDGGAILPTPALPELQKLHDIAPLKYDVCRVYANALAPNHHPGVEQVKQVMGPLLSYYLPAIWGEAWLVQDDPVQYGAAMNRAAALNPNHYLKLGNYYVTHHLEPDAARAYQAAIDHEADPVSVSNDCAWLVNYYYDHGQQERAMTVAQQAAEVYSSRGLSTLANLLERMDRLPEAESYYEKIHERYDSTAPLYGFYARAATTHPEYLEKMKGVEGAIFPQGMQEVTLAQLAGRPAKGVLVQGENALSRQAGLKPGAVVVGIDGKRVSNMEQYSFVRALATSPDLDLLVYQEGRYQAIRAHVPGRMFNLVFTTWP